ncbi:MAG: class I SAM-dependent methyltransferase [Alsobacter sp.]
MRSPIIKFYEQFPGDYAALTDERNIGLQCDFLNRSLLPGILGARVLELFAGPASHAHWLSQNHGHECWAVDTAGGMRDWAIRHGRVPAERYRLCNLPRLDERIHENAPFDAAFALIYSLGYLDLTSVGLLLRELADCIRPKGRLLFELHDLDRVRSGFGDLAIRERRVALADGGTLGCVWPSGTLQWSPDDWVLEMDVEVERRQTTEPATTTVYTSVERIHTGSEVAALGTMLGSWTCHEVIDAAFPDSRLVVLERSAPD